jgi:tetratricopeptide repeat protein 21B
MSLLPGARAWEVMGLIYEKEHSFQDACDCYERAWRYDHESNPAVGFKLSFNYLKGKRRETSHVLQLPF